jgi:hypothetical protein
MSRNTAAIRNMRFENLESRQLLAGDVLVNVVRGDLVIQGDAADNDIAITAGTERGTFVVTGLNGTTVHQEGQSPANEVTVSGMRRDVRINLGDGNDAVSLADANVRGNVTIRGGAGDDEIAIDETSIDGRLAIDAGTDDDTVNLGSAPDAGTTLSDGNGSLEGPLQVRNGIHVELGSGNDMVSLDRATTRAGIGVHGGLGDDTIGASLTTSKVLAITGGEGIDTVSLDGVEARHLGVHAGAGNDDVTIQDSVFTSLGVALGEGDDTLSVGGNEARIAVLVGGAGEDTLEELAENDFMFELVRGVEVPDDANTSNLPLPRRFAGWLDRLDDVSEGMVRELFARFGGGWHGFPRRR